MSGQEDMQAEIARLRAEVERLHALVFAIAERIDDVVRHATDKIEAAQRELDEALAREAALLIQFDDLTRSMS